MRCPQCGAENSTPLHIPDAGLVPECLRYDCPKCKFVWFDETEDQKQKRALMAERRLHDRRVDAGKNRG